MKAKNSADLATVSKQLRTVGAVSSVTGVINFTNLSLTASFYGGS